MSSKRAKSVEVSSVSLSRMPSRTGNASLTSRFTLMDKPKTPRMQRFARFTRHGQRYLKPQQTDFKIRTSVADLVMKELDAYDRCIFYQRVYILAKNIVLTVEADSSTDSFLTKYMQSKTSLISVEAAMDGEGEEVIESEMDEMRETDTANVETTLRIEAKSSQEEYRDSLLRITRADIEPPPKEKRMQELNFFDQFKNRLEDIVKQVEADQLSEDRLSGLLLCMGNSHSLLVIEGTEDTIANFCQELLSISNEYFEAMRVFMVEDRIEETYFDEFIYRHTVAMNITEKFPPPTANDPYLMGSQHWLIKEKLHTICRKLSYELRPVIPEVMDVGQQQPTIVIVEDEKKVHKKRRIIRRKKSPKRKKEKPTVKTSQATTEPTTRELREGFEDAGSMQSEIRGSITSGGSGKRADGSQAELEIPELQTELQEETELPEAQSTTAFETTAPPGTAAEEEATIQTITKETSIVRFPIKMEEKDVTVTSAALEEEENFEPREILSEFAISPTIYNRLLPEVQRIELVLTSKRFYLDVAEFLRLSQEIPMQPDEDASMWPTNYNYMPLNVFKRMSFDVNLTFGTYDANEESEESSSEDEEKDKADGEEGEKKQEEAG